MSEKVKIGVFGVGHLGKIHLKCLLGLPQYEVVGIYDPDEDKLEEVAGTFNVQKYISEEALIMACEAVDIVTSTSFHHKIAKKAILSGKHVFVEKPVTSTIDEAEELLELSAKHDVIIQVGHVERFNPVFQALESHAQKPMFIESHRLSNFNPRGTDVSVILDLMIHDLDIILHLVGEEVTDIQANGVAVLSDTPDICNARITFANGCVANVTSSRISMKKMRKMRIFGQDAYISMDFLEKTAQVIRLFDDGDPATAGMDNLIEMPTPKGNRLIHIDMPRIEDVNAIEQEFKDFYRSIREDSKPKVAISEGYKALKLAYAIMDKIK